MDFFAFRIKNQSNQSNRIQSYQSQPQKNRKWTTDWPPKQILVSALYPLWLSYRAAKKHLAAEVIKVRPPIGRPQASDQ